MAFPPAQRSIQERAEKRRRVVAWLEGRGLDGVVLTRRCNFSWYTCGAHNHVGEANDVGVSSLVAARDGAVVVANNIEATRLAGEALGDDINLIEYPYHDASARSKAFADVLAGGEFACDSAVAGFDLPGTDSAFDRLRWQLTPAEIGRYRVLCREVAECVESVARSVQPGMSEVAIAGRLAGELRARSLAPWVLLVGVDERIERYRHPLPTGKAVQRYAMLATCAERGGLIAAVTRLVSLAPISDELRRRQHATAGVDAALIASTVPGAKLGDIFAAGQAAYAEVGFADEWRLHHQGGSIGYLPREVKAEPGCEIEALADQAFAWNPSITGAKCEDTVLCLADGAEIMTDTGDWPMVKVVCGGRSFRRPDILAL